MRQFAFCVLAAIAGFLCGCKLSNVADAVFTGVATDDSVGSAVAGVGDVNGDGYDDVLIGAYNESTGGTTAGAVYLVAGPVSGMVSLSMPTASWVGENAYDSAGVAVAGAGDVNADGYADFVVGAPCHSELGVYSCEGAAYLIYGSPTLSGAGDLWQADSQISGENSSDNFGVAVAGAGDVNADGYDDITACADQNDADSSNKGACYIVFGPITADLWLDNEVENGTVAKFSGPEAYDYAGNAVGTADDTDGDGSPDLLVGAVAHGDQGSAYLIAGPIVAGTNQGLDEARAEFIPGVNSQQFGAVVTNAGDVNADGYGDIIITDDYDDTIAVDAGAALVYLGPVTGTVPVHSAAAKFYGTQACENVGASAAGVGDLTGDGYADLFIGAPGNDQNGSAAGMVYPVSGPVSGVHELILLGYGGDLAWDYAGAALANAGDVNGDGAGDVLVSAPGADFSATNAGAVFLLNY